MKIALSFPKGQDLRMPPAQRLMVKVIPRASKDEVVGMQGEALKVRLRAPPVDGAANESLRELLANHYGVSFSSVRILRGQTSRLKVVEIVGAMPGDRS